jgi:hypothetical protein
MCEGDFVPWETTFEAETFGAFLAGVKESVSPISWRSSPQLIHIDMQVNVKRSTIIHGRIQLLPSDPRKRLRMSSQLNFFDTLQTNRSTSKRKFLASCRSCSNSGAPKI